MKSKGFTLIELLAVIVILAIIALIAVPIVLNTIDNSKKESIKVSVENYLDAVEQAVAKKYLKDSQVNLDGTYKIDEESKGKKIIPKEVTEEETSREINIEYDGEVVDGGTIEIKDGKVVSAINVKINNYYAVLELGKIILLKEPKELPGLYQSDGTFVSWNDLVLGETAIISINDGMIEEISSTNVINLNGRLIIPEGVTSIGDSAFQNCINLTEVTIPESVTSIGTSAFEACSKLTRVTIPSSVISIGNRAFLGCSSIVKVIIDNGVISIGNKAFQNCKNLVEIKIPESVTSIGTSAFEACSKLTRVIIPNNVTRIESRTFYGCSNLADIKIPESVTSVGSFAFWYCKKLTGITIPSSVTSIEYGAFYGCSNLKEVIIPSSVTKIEGSAFIYCTSLTATIQCSDVTVGNNAFKNVPKVYYAGYQEGADYTSWGALDVSTIE